MATRTELFVWKGMRAIKGKISHGKKGILRVRLSDNSSWGSSEPDHHSWSKTVHMVLLQLGLHLTLLCTQKGPGCFSHCWKGAPEEVAEPLDFQMVFESGCWQSYKEYFAIVTFWRWFCCCVWFWIQKLFFLDSKKLCLSSAPDDIIFQIWWHNINKKDNALENGFRNRNIS